MLGLRPLGQLKENIAVLGKDIIVKFFLGMISRPSMVGF